PQAGAATTATYAGPTLVDGMDYYFEVRVNDSMDWSLPWEYVLFHTNTPPPAPDLLTPADGSTGISAGSVGLTWNASVDLDGDTVTYDWQVSTSATFAVIFASGTSSTTSATVTGALAGTQYFWRVRAHDGWEYGNYSATWDFSIASPPPPPPPTTGNITVHIVDSSGADISGATVELRNATGAVVATLTTNATGRVTFPGRAFGSYTARVTKTGYQEGLSAVIPLSLGNLNPSVDVTLQATITQPQPAPFPWWILALIAIVVAVVLLLLLFMRRRRKPQEEVPPAGGAQVPTTLPAAPPAGEIPGQAPATPGGRESAAPAISEISVVSPQGAAAPGQGPTVTPPTAPAAGPDIQARLAKLDQLKAKGLIDEATYQQKRRELLGQ
ncbi:MAG TPA: carboxypeptidase regulatory-like domain-containing protein, partial [Thermoplasmata archaeon]|nr:carboxypeptidase regulatory-like domain-containing protein [Thermoplasmata archaeon]